jgi:hypothetical protein
MKPILFFLFTGIMLMGTSCTDDENVGPQGPQGPAGNANVQAVLFTNRPFTYNQLANVYQVLVVCAPDHR